MASKVLRGRKEVMATLDAAVAKLGAGTLSVGFMNGATYPDGTPVAAVAFWNEFGNINAPARPFFRRMIEAEASTWGPKMTMLAKSSNYDGNVVLSLMGEDIKGALQQSINDLTSPPLAQSTIDRKGFSKPLIDTSHMINSITYKVDP